MTTSKESRKIVAAVVGLGQSLGITTVAEGIETEEQDEMLLWLGCDQGQGWHVWPPCAGGGFARRGVCPGRAENRRVALWKICSTGAR